MTIFLESPSGIIQDYNLTLEQWVYLIILPIILVFLVTAYIGLERQNVGKAAGISAHVLVGLSAAGIAIMQQLMFLNQIAVGIQDAEGQRVIAQVVTGIGFIGAGVIMKDPKNVIHGITTAATLWFAALIGVIIGSGYILLGVFLSAFVVIFMTIRDIKRGINPLKPQRNSVSQIIKKEIEKERQIEAKEKRTVQAEIVKENEDENNL